MNFSWMSIIPTPPLAIYGVKKNILEGKVQTTDKDRVEGQEEDRAKTRSKLHPN